MGISTDMTVIEKLDTYLETALLVIKPSTEAVYRRYMRSYIEPHFQGMSYSAVTSVELQDFVTKLTQNGLSAVTVQPVFYS